MRVTSAPGSTSDWVQILTLSDASVKGNPSAGAGGVGVAIAFVRLRLTPLRVTELGIFYTGTGTLSTISRRTCSDCSDFFSDDE